MHSHQNIRSLLLQSLEGVNTSQKSLSILFCLPFLYVTDIWSFKIIHVSLKCLPLLHCGFWCIENCELSKLATVALAHFWFHPILFTLKRWKIETTTTTLDEAKKFHTSTLNINSLNRLYDTFPVILNRLCKTISSVQLKLIFP